MKPIIFSTPMVQAILEGRKTQTRRLFDPQFSTGIPEGKYRYDGIQEGIHAIELLHDGKPTENYYTCGNPKYDYNNTLYVRETWTGWDENVKFLYRADTNMCEKARDDMISLFDVKWKPSIHMPKEAARIFLRVTNVRAERLQDISADDCIEEGIVIEWSDELPKPSYQSLAYSEKRVKPAFIKAFAALWNNINEKRGYGWDTNPWVWVYEFERIEKP